MKKILDYNKPGFKLHRPIEIKSNIVLGLEQLGAQFIGRRKEIRRIEEDFFTHGIRAVVLHGIGGIGKTVTASKIVEKIKNHFNGIFAFDCSGGLKTEEILINLNEFLKRNGVDALDQVCSAQAPIDIKINYLGQVLSQIKFLLIFDNFETLLLEEKNKWEIADSELKRGLKTLFNQCKDSTRFIFTSRNTFNLIDGRHTNAIDEINLGELSKPEAIMVMNRFPAIAKEDFSTKIEIYKKIGGHPYTINIFGKHANQRSVKDVLMDIAVVNKEMVEFTLLNKSYEFLGDSARDLIDRASVFKKLIPSSGLEWMMKDNGQLPDISREINELIHWGLIIKIEEDEERNGAFYQVHTLVKDFIKDKTDEAERKKRLIKAAGFYEDLVIKTKSLWDHLDARELYFEAEEFDKAGNIVTSVTEYLHRWGFIELVQRLNEQTIENASDSIKAGALHNLGIILENQGDYDKAQEKYNQSLKIEKELGDKQGIAETLHELGNLHYHQGDYDKAIEMYNQSLKIKKELGNKKGIALTTWGLGNIYLKQGERSEAKDMYNRSLKIFEELKNELNIAGTLQQLGVIYKHQGDYETALDMYNRSLKIKKELGDKQGIAVSLHELGIIHKEQGDYDKAMEKCNRSLKISEEIRDKIGIASTLQVIGTVYEEKKYYKNALRNYLTSFSIFKSLNSPSINIVINSINVIKEKVGEEMFTKSFNEIMEEMREKENG